MRLLALIAAADLAYRYVARPRIRSAAGLPPMTGFGPVIPRITG